MQPLLRSTHSVHGPSSATPPPPRPTGPICRRGRHVGLSWQLPAAHTTHTTTSDTARKQPHHPSAPASTRPHLYPSHRTQAVTRRTSPASAPSSTPLSPPPPTAGPGTSSRTHQPLAQTSASLAQQQPTTPAPHLFTTLLAKAQVAAAQLLSSPHDPVILSLAAPAILALAADPLLAMVDTAIVGHLGRNELAALGVNNSLFSFAFVVFNFLSTATTPMVATALSSGDKKKSGETIVQALSLASVLGVLVLVGLRCNADAALQLMGLPMDGTSDPELVELARNFLMLRATAAPAALLVTVAQGVFRGLQDMRTPLGVTLATNVVHLAFSLILIFPGDMGLSGAAVSTSVAEWLAAGAYLYLGYQRRSELGLDALPVMDLAKTWRQYLPFLQAGGAVLMRTCVLLGTKTLASAVATRLGPSSIASHQVITQVWSMSSLLIDSLGISGQTLVAVSLGHGDRRTARQVTDRLLQLGLGLGLTLAAILTLLGPAWPHIFTEDEDVLRLVSQLMPLAVCMLPLNALVYVLDGVLVGAGDFQFLVGAMVVASALTTSLLLSVEPLHLGLTGVWVAQVVLMAGRAGTLGMRYWSSSGPLPPMADEEPLQLAAASGLGPAEEEFALVARSSSGSSSSSSSGSGSSLESSELVAMELQELAGRAAAVYGFGGAEQAETAQGLYGMGGEEAEVLALGEHGYSGPCAGAGGALVSEGGGCVGFGPVPEDARELSGAVRLSLAPAPVGAAVPSSAKA